MRTSPMNDGLPGPKLALGQPTPMNYRGMTAGASPQLFSPRRHPCFTLGRSAAGGGETSLERHEALVDLVHVPREVVDAGDVLVAQVAVADEGDAQVGAWPALLDAPGDRPDLPLGPVDQPSQAARRVQDEGHPDPRGGGPDARR